MTETKSVPVTKRMVWQAYKKVRANRGAPGVDAVNVQRFEEKLGDNLYVIWNRMTSGSYMPPAVKQVSIPKGKGKLRQLGIPTIGDRTAQMVVKQYLEPRYEQLFSANSYGYRANKSAHQALDRCVHNCRLYGWLIDLDIQGFFDNLRHDTMLELLEREVSEKWVKLYVTRWLKAPAFIEGKEEQRSKGTPQGGVISPLLANIYLHYAFDTWIEKENRCSAWERYADDIVVHCTSREEAQKVLQQIRERLSSYGLQLNESKTKIVYCKQQNRQEEHEEVSFDFLGYQFKPLLNSKVRGWLNYYSRYNPKEMRYEMYRINLELVKWVRRKYKVTGKYRARAMLQLKQQRFPKLFAHWQAGFHV